VLSARQDAGNTRAASRFLHLLSDKIHIPCMQIPSLYPFIATKTKTIHAVLSRCTGTWSAVFLFNAHSAGRGLDVCTAVYESSVICMTLLRKPEKFICTVEEIPRAAPRNQLDTSRPLTNGSHNQLDPYRSQVKYLWSPSCLGRNVARRSNAAPEISDSRPTTMYAIPKKWFRPPSHDVLVRTSILRPPKFVTGKL
jgi:hypothetical protein